MSRYPDNFQPETFRSNVRETLLAEILDGNSIKEAAQLPGMPTERQIKLWLAQDDTLRAEFIEAQKVSLMVELSRIVDIADGHEGFTTQRDRLRVDTRLKIAERLIPEIYGKTNTHVIEPGKSLTELLGNKAEEALELPSIAVN